MIHASLGPGIEAAGVNDDLTRRVQFHVCTIHGPWRRSFKVDSFRRVTTAVAGALEFVLRRFPVGRAAQMSAATKDYEDAVGFPNHRDAGLGLESLIHAWLEIRWVPDFENRAGFEKCAWKEKAEEHQEISGEKTPNTTPYDSSPHFSGRRDLFNSSFGFGRRGLRGGLGRCRDRMNRGRDEVGVVGSLTFAITESSLIGFRDYILSYLVPNKYINNTSSLR